MSLFGRNRNFMKINSMVVIQEEKLPLLNGKKMWKKMVQTVERREREQAEGTVLFGFDQCLDPL